SAALCGTILRIGLSKTLMSYGPRILLALAAFLVVAAVAAFSLHRSSAIQSGSSTIDENAEEYAVYSALIRERFINEHVKILVIQNRTLYYANPDYLKSTTAEERIQDLKKYCPSVDESALNDFEAKHMKPGELDANFTLPLKYVLVDKAEFDEAQTKDGREIV